jgi:hypothetical protein
MTVKFYTPSADIPVVQKSVIDVVKIYVCDILYANELVATRYHRFILSDIEAGNQFIVRKSIEAFKTSMGKFPFTAYNIGEIEEQKDSTNFFEKSGMYYFDKYNTNVTSLPVTFELQMISMFTSPSDFFYAQTLLYQQSGVLTRLVVPILINAQTEYFYVNVLWEIGKGGLAFKYEDYEQFGRIYDLVHTMKISMRYFKLLNATILPVNDVILSLQNFNNIGTINPSSIDTIHISDQPIINSIVPANGAIGINKSSSITSIIITFNTIMNEESVNSFINIYPTIDYTSIWDTNSTILTLSLKNDLSSLTLYTITIINTAVSYWNNNLDSTYTFTFTTGV